MKNQVWENDRIAVKVQPAENTKVLAIVFDKKIEDDLTFSHVDVHEEDTVLVSLASMGCRLSGKAITAA
jgi:hypothetical protein